MKRILKILSVVVAVVIVVGIAIGLRPYTHAFGRCFRIATGLAPRARRARQRARSLLSRRRSRRYKLQHLRRTQLGR
ncbi:lipase/acylhydrolase with GDSL-like motif [Cutibacterium acnes JCM 18918]|nr:lipase/acylhydrolase with GDSL-like motif [Cutibacterium acnes JCM 18918]